MCLIVLKENEESIFTNRQFKNMISRNRDGLGIMWRENGRVRVAKSVGTPREKFQLWQQHKDKPMYAMHSRLTTHGYTNLDNCHPYEIMNIDKGDPIDLYMMHNGVLNQAPEVDKKMSDTWHFVEYILKPIAKSNIRLLWDNDEFQIWLQKIIGGSKFLFMRSDDVESPVLILNSQAGNEETGCWLSNSYSTGNQYNNTTYYNRNYNKATNSYNYGGGTVSKQNPTHPTNHTTSQTHTTVTTIDNYEMAWEDFVANRRNNITPIEKTEKLFLPDYSKSDKVVEFKPNNSKEKDHPEDYLIRIVSQLKGLSTHSIKEWVKEDPDQTADVVLALYEKNTLPYELIIQQINDDKGVDGIVDIIRHIISYNLAPKAIKNA